MRPLLQYPKCIRTFTSSLRVANIEKSSSQSVIFSGIQPTGIPHLGNYLGAVKNWVDLQYTSNQHDVLIYSIVGWHALTLPQNPGELRKAKLETAASLLALGIDPKRSILFHQDEVSEHLSLCWILTCLTPMGKLKRMTTWKNKLAIARNANSECEVDDSMLNLGLFAYPVLQAADILAYQASHVPVGEDQLQHLELCRDLAHVFNRRYETESERAFFTMPQAILTTCPRILSFRDPTQKMSKSLPDATSRVALTDTASTINKIVRSAVTDSVAGITYDPVTRPGISNLLTILGAFRGSRSREELLALASEYSGKGAGELKEDVADAIVEWWRHPRDEFGRLRGDEGYLLSVLEDGRQRAEAISRGTLSRVRALIGL